jgi:uncharacterized protein (DUF1015 family)
VSQVSPFVGLSFDHRAGPLEMVTSPPYDTISPEQQRRFRDVSPFNIVWVDIGEERPGDDVDAKYRRAASQFDRWRRDGVLKRAERPAYYAYEMRFVLDDRPRGVRGLICQVELEPWGGSVIPHEQTMPGPIEDRLRLMRAVRANLSAVYALLPRTCPQLCDLLETVSSGRPAARITDEAGVEHRMWVLGGPEPVERAAAVAALLREENLLIADGHHRYTVALRYRDEMRRAHGPGPWDQVMMLVVDAEAEDPPVLPIHRVLVRGQVRREGKRVADLAGVLAEVDDQALIYGFAGLEDGTLVHRVARLEGPPPTVSALHRQILGEPGRDALRFTPDAAAAEAAVRSGRADAAFFLPPTNAERIRAVIEVGARLPQKSTYFWPKPRTGLVIRPFD